MTYCPGCGTKTIGEWSHCPECGEALASGASAETEGESSTYPIGRAVSLAAVVLIASGAFFPWVSASVLGSKHSIEGIGTAGQLSLGVALLVGICILSEWTYTAQTVSTFGGLVTTVLAAVIIYDPFLIVERQVEELAPELVSPDVGLYATLVGGLVLTVAGVYALSNESSEPRILTQWRGAGADEGPADDTPSEPLGYERGLDALPVEQREAGEAVLARLEENEVVTTREFQRQVYPDNPVDYDSEADWWEGFARPFLADNEAVEQLDDTGRRWSLR